MAATSPTPTLKASTPWFTRDRRRLGFIQKLLRWPCHGDSTFTFSDVEHAVPRVMLKRNYLERCELRAAEALRAVRTAPDSCA